MKLICLVIGLFLLGTDITMNMERTLEVEGALSSMTAMVILVSLSIPLLLFKAGDYAQQRNPMALLALIVWGCALLFSFKLTYERTSATLEAHQTRTKSGNVAVSLPDFVLVL